MPCVADSDLIPVKISLTDTEADTLERIAEKRRKERRSKQIGKGTIASEIVARVLSEHPELMTEWFGNQGFYLEPTDEDQEPKKGRGKR